MAQDAETMTCAAPWLAFAGNSLLAPPTQTGAKSLEPGFWADLARCDKAGIADAAHELDAFACGIVLGDTANDGTACDLVRAVSVEFAHLFVGPPKPAVAPWETFYRQPGCTVGFGTATGEMRAALREHGLELAQPGRQYEDHMGVELLLLSELCRRAGSDDGRDGSESSLELARMFARQHPCAWIDDLSEAVRAERPDGYYTRLLAFANALLEVVLRG